MLSTEDSLRIVGVGVVILVALSLSVAWFPAGTRYPGGLPARVFVAAGLAAAIWDAKGIGILGAVLAALGTAIWWAGRPPAELPRPRRTGFTIAAAIAAVVTLAMMLGWGTLGGIPQELRAVATTFIAAVGVLGTLAIADRSRITFRDALRRYRQPPSLE